MCIFYRKLKVVVELKDEQWMFEKPLLGKAEKRSGSDNSELFFRYGLNDCTVDEPKKEDSTILVVKRFPPLAWKQRRVARGNRHQALSVIKLDHFLKLFRKKEDSNLPNVLKFSRIHLHCVKYVRTRSYSGQHFPAFRMNMELYGVSLRIKSECEKMRTRITLNTDTFHAILVYMNKSKLMKNADLLNETLNEHCCHNRFFQWLLAVLVDVIGSKTYKPPPAKPKHKSLFATWKIFFKNKVIEFYNLPSILYDPIVSSTIPSDINNFDVPTVVYNLEKPIYSRNQKTIPSM